MIKGLIALTSDQALDLQLPDVAPTGFETGATALRESRLGCNTIQRIPRRLDQPVQREPSARR
jgi:hypothetical protein